jgi:uncharacterized membrane protein SpoIIM required for sporulation
LLVVDIDRFMETHQPTWSRLDDLTRRGQRGIRRLSADEIDELVRLYQRVSGHLSLARTYYRDDALITHLTGLVARAGALVYGTRARTLRAAARFVTHAFPAAMWHARWFIGVSAALFLLPAAAVAVWLATTPAALDLAGPEALREAYVAEDFADYYTRDPSAQFAAFVTTNNIRVAATAFAGGILVCIPTGIILLINGANVGVAAGLFAAAGQLPLFWGLILPHGLLELTAVFVAGGAGLRLGWTLVDPGDRPRRSALTEEGRRAIVIVIGLVGVFLVAGLIEGFVTGAPWPTWARVGIGVTAWAAFLTYAAGLGHAAAAQGLTGALGEDTPYSRPVALTSR